MNHLSYGDNLLVLRESIADESVDLIYLRGGGGDKRGKVDGRADPPFNSKRDYNLLFKNDYENDYEPVPLSFMKVVDK